MSIFRVDVPDRRTWSLLAANAAVLFALGAWFGFSVDPRKILQALAGVGVLLATAAFYTTRRPDPTIAAACGVFAFLLLYPAIFLPLSYVTAALDRPLQDALLVRMDRALGFDWLALQQATFATDWLRQASFLVYAHAHWAIIGSWLVLILTGQFARIRAYALMLTLTSTIGLTIAALFPVIGAYGYYEVAGDMLASLKGTGAGQWHIADFNAVRAGTLRVIVFEHLQGIVQFPSFHTVGALTAAWATWRTPYVKWPLLAFNAFVVFTAIPVGGHHLMDVLGGVVLTALGLLLVRRPAINSIKRSSPVFRWTPSTDAG